MKQQIKNCISFFSFFFLSIVFLLGHSCIAQQNDTLLLVMKEELNREMAELQKASVAAYYIDYRVNESETAVLKSSFGSITESFSGKKRILTTRVKVGNYSFDNSHPADGMNQMGMSGYSIPMIIPVENSLEAIKFSLWESTQANYKMAKEVYTSLKSVPDAQIAKRSLIPDFSKELPSQYYDQPLENLDKDFDKNKWAAKIKKLNNLFLVNSKIVKADVEIQFNRDRKYFVSTEGSSVVQNQTYCQLIITCAIRAEDGDVLPLYKTYFAFSPNGIPPDADLVNDIKIMIAKLEKLGRSPLAEPYSGPAILNAKTSGVFFHEIFGHRIEGHRLKNESDGQTFAGKVNEPVLPKTFSVIFDPTISDFGNKPLNGFYKYDDEGIQSRRVTVVEKGILKNFLMSRSPLAGFLTSNGHGRTSAGGSPVSRQSNMFIETSQPHSDAELRKMLIKECKKQKKEYGYMFEDVIGGYTTTGRNSPNAFNIFPTEVYRVYVDGRPDELVHGVDLIGTPLSMFAEIKAAGENKEIFAGICGAESGGVPVTAISPSIFVNRIETQRKFQTNLEPTILERPVSNEK